MATATRIVGGILRTVEITASISHYDESILVNTDIGTAGTGYNSAHTIFTLPSSQTYNPNLNELKVYVNGVLQIESVEYDYDFGSAPSATTIEFATAIPRDSRVNFIIEGA